MISTPPAATSVNAQMEISLIGQRVVLRRRWVAYAVHNNLFVKQFCSLPGAKYPDGCSGILFTNAGQSQLETKSPITCLEPQGIKEHVEDWYLFDGVPRPENDGDVERFVLPHLQTLLMASPSSNDPGSPNNTAGLP